GRQVLSLGLPLQCGRLLAAGAAPRSEKGQGALFRPLSQCRCDTGESRTAAEDLQGPSMRRQLLPQSPAPLSAVSDQALQGSLCELCQRGGVRRGCPPFGNVPGRAQQCPDR